MDLFIHAEVITAGAFSINVRTALKAAYAMAQLYEYDANGRRVKRKKPPKTPSPIGSDDLLRALILSTGFGNTQVRDLLAELGVTPEALAAWRDAQRD